MDWVRVTQDDNERFYFEIQGKDRMGKTFWWATCEEMDEEAKNYIHRKAMAEALRHVLRTGVK